jgi:ketol-acid reductoisomerase
MIALMWSFQLVLFMMRLTIIGFGNQAKAWSQNLQDSAFPFRVALKPDSASFEKVVELGMETVEIGSKEFFEDRAFVLLTPDHTHQSFMTTYGQLFHEGSLILYNHGFSLNKNKFQENLPHLKHVLFAVKAIGSEIRQQYLSKGKFGAVYSLEYVKGETASIEDWMKKMAQALGVNMGIFKTTFLHETQADLYSEQGLLCSLIPYTAGEMFKHLIESGIEPELAYLEVWHEMKLIAIAMVDKGPEGFFDLISPNALVGSEKGFQKLITPEFKSNLRNLLTDIQNNKFNEELENTDVEELRKTIRNRWTTSPLMKTFKDMNAKEKNEKT